MFKNFNFFFLLALNHFFYFFFLVGQTVKVTENAEYTDTSASGWHDATDSASNLGYN